MARGLSNFNPGNIRIGGQKFIGEKDKSTDKAFRQFVTMAFGYRAMFVLLRNYIKNGNNTIVKIISKYAPSNENNTTAYINAVEKGSGINSNTIIQINDLDSLTKIIMAMSMVENAVKAVVADVLEGKKLLIQTYAMEELEKKKVNN